MQLYTSVTVYYTAKDLVMKPNGLQPTAAFWGMFQRVPRTHQPKLNLTHPKGWNARLYQNGTALQHKQCSVTM